MQDPQREYPIEFLDGQKFSPERRQKDPGGFQAALRKAHEASQHAVCQCGGGGQCRLYIARHGTQFRIARFPNSGLEHAPDCRWYELPAEASGLGGYEDGVIAEGEDGSTRVKLRVSLTRAPAKEAGAGAEEVAEEEAEASAKEESAAPADDDEVQAKRSMSELGLLHLLWTQTHLNRWHPDMAGKRGWSLVGWTMQQAAQQLKVGRTWLSSVLVVVPPARSDRQDKVRANIQKAVGRVIERAAGGKVPRMIVLGELAGLSRAGEMGELHLAHGKRYGIQFMSTRLQVASLERRFPDAKRALAERSPEGAQTNTRVIGLFVAEPRVEEELIELTYVSGGLMVTTWDFLPFVSSYEREVVDQLVTQRRSFERPMRFEAGENLVFPDFLLTDTEMPVVPMEVYGRQDPNHDARVQMRQELYPRLFPDARRWEWVIDEADSLPDFPPAKQGTPAEAAVAAGPASAGDEAGTASHLVENEQA